MKEEKQSEQILYALVADSKIIFSIYKLYKLTTEYFAICS